MTRRLLGDEAAAIAGSLLVLYPPAFFLSAPYSDALGLALSLGALERALDGRFGAAGALGFLSALTRPTGVLLASALWLQRWQRRRQDPGWRRQGARPGSCRCWACSPSWPPRRGFGDLLTSLSPAGDLAWSDGLATCDLQEPATGPWALWRRAAPSWS